MAKAKFTLSNGTVVEIDGSSKDIKELLGHYSGDAGHPQQARRKTSNRKQGAVKANAGEGNEEVDVAKIVNLIKDCDEAEAIERHVLDKRGRLNRVLLPLYIVHQYMNNAYPLTSGDIAKVTAELGVPIDVRNVAPPLSSEASRFVMGDKARRKGSPVRYQLNRRGIKHMQEVLKDNGSK